MVKHGAFFIVIFLFSFSARGVEYDPEKVKAFVLANLSNPDTAQFRLVSGQCGEVKYRDFYGLDSGFKRFIAKSGSEVIIEQPWTRRSFEREWRRVCK